MRTVLAFVVGIAVGLSYTLPAVADELQPPGSATSAQNSPSHSDELHFVDVLTVRGEIVSVDKTNRLVTLKDPRGNALMLEARNENDLEAIKTGDRVVVQYFEGAQIGKKESGEPVPSLSLKDGIIGREARKEPRMIVASVEGIDDMNQEVTLKGTDGSLETIMVTNPEYLKRIKVGDRVVITRAQALALLLNKES